MAGSAAGHMFYHGLGYGMGWANIMRMNMHIAQYCTLSMAKAQDLENEKPAKPLRSGSGG